MNHQDPRYDTLEALGDWQLEDESQDIRGRPLVSPTGATLGVIDELMVDKVEERVAAIRLNNGSFCAIEGLELFDDRVVYQDTEAEAATARARTDTTKEAVPLVEESVAVGKRTVNGGSIKLRARVVTDVVREDVPLRKESVKVDHVTLDQDISPRQANKLFEDKTVEVTAHNEEAVVAKTAKVTGKVVVSKEAEQTVEHVEETVRRSEVQVDRTDAKSTKQRR